MSNQTGDDGPTEHPLRDALREPAQAVLLLDSAGSLAGFNRPLLELFDVASRVSVNALPERALEHLRERLEDQRELERVFAVLTAGPAAARHEEVRLSDGRLIRLLAQPQHHHGELLGWVVRLEVGAARDAIGDSTATRPEAILPGDATLLEELEVAVIVRDRNGEILRANATAMRLLEDGAGELRAISEEGIELRGLEWPDRLARQTGCTEQGILGIPGTTGVRWLWACAAPMAPDTASSPFGVIVSLTDITAYKIRQDERGRRALHDSLTGLPSRALFMDELARADARAVRAATLTGVMFLDIDGFKAVNDRFGHAAGDELLSAVAKRIRAAVRPADTVARYGGDEFVVLCENIGGEREIRVIAERVRREVALPLSAELPSVSVSVGSAVAERASNELISQADLAMYRAKAVRGAPNA